eukprot:5188116-Karenia_brevis.AAC.1
MAAMPRRAKTGTRRHKCLSTRWNETSSTSLTGAMCLNFLVTNDKDSAPFSQRCQGPQQTMAHTQQRHLYTIAETEHKN